MSLADNCEVLARDLGVWREPGTAHSLRRDDEALVEGAFAGWRWYEGRADEPRWELVMRVDGELRRHRLDQWTLALLLLGRARGERVDFGRCPECGGSGHWVDVGPFVDPAMVLRSRRLLLRMVSHGHGLPESMTHLPMGATVLLDGCPACAVQDKPTGRDVRPWERAVLDAMPRDTGGVGRLGVSQAYLEGFKGDTASRDALAAHVHLCSGPEHAVVLGDWLLAFPGRPLSELPPPTAGLGVLLSAWLRGVIVAHTDRLKSETRAELTPRE